MENEGEECNLENAKIGAIYRVVRKGLFDELTFEETQNVSERRSFSDMRG